ncbi:M23 family metallopeptidase [Flaviflexus equikiangi]|uniref:M23 family metallopeptidase n=1 Tax=Flaviflexus equikiangi TaxID=2758573 RepID=UPI0015F48E83|nr:M23 family metallopeptidase [Flaviflexus equikiangi]
MGRHSAVKVPVSTSVLADDAPTERLAAIPAAPSRRDRRMSSKASARRLRARATMVAASSLVAGFGAASVISGTGQAAAAVTPSVPVTTSLGDLPVVGATVPDSFASSDEAADIALLRTAQELAETAAEPAVCSTEPANGLVSAVMQTSDNVVVMPAKEGTYRLSSGYGVRWNPISGGYHTHLGSDFAGALGTPIYAVADGTVEYVGAGKDGRSNNLVIIKHEVDGTVFWSWYVHMFDDGIHVSEGDVVAAGQHIADIGNNGNSTGPHLHLEIHTDESGTTVNPLTFLADLGAQDVSTLCS